MVNDDQYPTLVPVGLGIVLSLVLNFGAPIVASLLARKLKRRGWWPHSWRKFLITQWGRGRTLDANELLVRPCVAGITGASEFVEGDGKFGAALGSHSLSKFRDRRIDVGLDHVSNRNAVMGRKLLLGVL